MPKTYDFKKWDVKLIQEPNELLETLKNFNIKNKVIKSIKLIGIAFNFEDDLEEEIYNKINDEELSKIENFKDEYEFFRSIHIDEPIIIEFEDGDKLEIDYSECGSLKIGLNSLPEKLESRRRKPNVDLNVLFSNCIGEKLRGYEVTISDDFELNHDFTWSYDIEEPNNQKTFIAKLSLVLTNNVVINISSFVDFGVVWISTTWGDYYNIKWKELKSGIIYNDR